MSNKEQCVALLDDFTEAQLVNVAAMLKTMKQTVTQAPSIVPIMPASPGL